MSESPLFILAGNGAYLNRGCEAIVRGTVSILRKQYADPRFLCISYFNSREEFEDQRKNEVDRSIQHLSCFHPKGLDAVKAFYRPATWRYIYRSLWDEKQLGRSLYAGMMPQLPDATAVLSIAADNYSLYHGTARLFVALDDLVLGEGRPLALWGASVGPFDREPDYEAFMGRHLREANGIFAREPTTVDYLERIGVTENVHRAADPAFLLDAVRPEGIEDSLPIDGEAIGLNFSPRMAGHATGGDLDAWSRRVASIISTVAKNTEMPICLIPHATRSCSDDHAFMRGALSLAERADDVVLVPPKYDAAGTKWIIGRMSAFAGARTHSVIAALSSGVPTLTLSYGVKSLGINRDIFGDTRYCLEPGDLSPAVVADRLAAILDDRNDIRDHLARRIPGTVDAALSAGTTLKGLVDGR
ncbi:MAG: polysaccharide pyruvyl transferase family protein [Methanomassiliicoccus sp.]|nr:polysaccharide pyruvyl transferase family protein [Methanomassiliicoccus sp.]